MWQQQQQPWDWRLLHAAGSKHAPHMKGHVDAFVTFWIVNALSAVSC
jgi:hypothetical protein